MAHIRKIETNQRRNGKPVAHYEVRWTETVVTADGTRRKKYKQETFPTKASWARKVQKLPILANERESRILGYMPDGTPIYSLFGAERAAAGYSTAGDVFDRTIDGREINDLWSEFQTTLQIVNEQRTAVTNLLCFRTTNPADHVAQTVGDDDFEVASEFGEPVSLASKPRLISTGYEFRDYDKAARFTHRFLRDAPAQQIEELHARALYADNKLTTNAILNRLLDPTPGENEDGRTVYGLYNGDDMVPPRFGFKVHEAGHTHYFRSGAEEWDGGDIDTMAQHILEHGYGTIAGSRLLLFASHADAEQLAGLRAGSGPTAEPARYDFIPSEGAPTYLTDQAIVGDLAPAEINGLPIAGSYGRVWVVPTDFMPAGYLLMAAKSGANDSRNPVGFREHPNVAAQGLRLLPGPRESYPLVDSFYTRAFGVGVRHRGAAVAMQLGAAGDYEPPSALPPSV